jgi:hypothetical protein
MFGSRFTESLDESHQVAGYAAPYLWREGRWTADYRRPRIARKTLRTETPRAS